MNIINVALSFSFFLLCCSMPEEGQFCGGKYYNEQTEFCYYYPPRIYTKCNGQKYDPDIRKCSEDGSRLQRHCNGIVYEYPSQFCSDTGVVDKGAFTDSRDGKEYKTVVIGEQTWMAENLNYEAEGSQCYNDDPKNCETYGRLYDWETALAACSEKDGWYLPNEADFSILDNKVYRLISIFRLVSDDDVFGFSALPGGFISEDGRSMYIEKSGYWWLSRENKEEDKSAPYFKTGINFDWGYDNKSAKFSIRCIKN